MSDEKMKAKDLFEGGTPGEGAAPAQTLDEKRTAALAAIQQTFIQERVNGYFHPQTGEPIPPVPLAEAEQKWEKVLPKFVQRLAETDDSFFDQPPGGQPPGSTTPQNRPMPRRPMPPRMRPPGMPGDMDRVLGRGGPPEQQGLFNRQEMSQLKDLTILMLAKLVGSPLDEGIAEALIAGKELDRNQLQHLLDECSRLKVPESHAPVLQKLYQHLRAPQKPPG